MKKLSTKLSMKKGKIADEPLLGTVIESTGKFDCNNKELFVGDKILHAWGWFNWKGKMRTQLRVHTIVKKPAHKMNNGEMHDDSNGFIYCMGNSYNFWKGKEVQKISKKDTKSLKVKEDESFFFDDENNPIIVTDQHFLGLSDEDWELEKKRRYQFFADTMFGAV